MKKLSLLFIALVTNAFAMSDASFEKLAEPVQMHLKCKDKETRYFPNASVIFCKNKGFEVDGPYVALYEKSKRVCLDTWKDKLREGLSTCYKEGKKSTETMFVKDKPNGLMIEFYDEKPFQRGQLVNGKMDGIWEMLTPSGHVFSKTHFKLGEKSLVEILEPDTGMKVMEFKFENGAMKSGSFIKDGVATGPATEKDYQAFLERISGERVPKEVAPKKDDVVLTQQEFLLYLQAIERHLICKEMETQNDNGRLYHFCKRNGFRGDGRFASLKNGTLCLGEWANKVTDGKYVCSIRGMVTLEASFRMGRLDGPFKEYYPNGAKKSAGWFKENELHFTWEHFNITGNLTHRIGYKYGVLDGFTATVDPKSGKDNLIIKLKAGKFVEARKYDEARKSTPLNEKEAWELFKHFAEPGKDLEQPIKSPIQKKSEESQISV